MYICHKEIQKPANLMAQNHRTHHIRPLWMWLSLYWT